jgi:hypothetical protein
LVSDLLKGQQDVDALLREKDPSLDLTLLNIYQVLAKGKMMIDPWDWGTLSLTAKN